MSALRSWLLFVALAAAAVEASAQAPAPPVSFAAARTLYASAEYGGALEMLNGLVASNPTAADRQAIDLYRALCLVAVGNSDEALQIIDGMILHDPLYRPAADDVPPRLRAAFTEARRRLLPAIAQEGYVAAKAAFDRKEYETAAAGFTRVLAALNDADMAPASEQPPLADLKMLATGFRDLAVKAPVPPPAPVPAPEPAAHAPESTVEPPAPLAPVEQKSRVYAPGDSNVVPPVTVRQALPPYPGRVQNGGSLTIDVVIDVNGAVESATLAGPPDPIYDRLVLSAAKEWLYQPATLNGRPVKYRKRILVTLVPSGR